MKIDFASAILPKSGILAVLVDEGAKLLTLGALADKRCNGQLSKAIKAAKFEGKRDSVLDCLAPGGGFDRILIVGIGAADSLAAKDVELLGGTICSNSAISGSMRWLPPDASVLESALCGCKIASRFLEITTIRSQSRFLRSVSAASSGSR